MKRYLKIIYYHHALNVLYNNSYSYAEWSLARFEKKISAHYCFFLFFSEECAYYSNHIIIIVKYDSTFFFEHKRFRYVNNLVNKINIEFL